MERQFPRAEEVIQEYKEDHNLQKLKDAIAALREQLVLLRGNDPYEIAAEVLSEKENLEKFLADEQGNKLHKVIP